ncbi:hypothetical protein CCY97_01840 [Helicobacter sp. 10-6591]|nr:hypothetical protein CCY97_01840 [Helicobacter sp. 10-6591]
MRILMNPKTQTKPKIAFVTAGGTILGIAENSVSAKYKAGILDNDSLLIQIPEIHQLAEIINLEFAKIDSADMDNPTLLKLAFFLQELLEDPSIQGIVITHGTDSLEESAYFLSLILQSSKPVIFTASMRPSNVLSYDGSRSLYNAFLLASRLLKQLHKTENNVFVVIGDFIYHAHQIRKTHTLSTAAFEDTKPLGSITNSQIFFHMPKLKTNKTELPSIYQLKDKLLPRVEILYAYQNDSCASLATFLFAQGVRGFVIAGLGAGNINNRILKQDEVDCNLFGIKPPITQKMLLQALNKHGAFIVMSSRVNNALIAHSEFLNAYNLNPQKARILLMLALSAQKFQNLKTLQSRRKWIENIFSTEGTKCL